ncbi:hypothetical protein ACVW0Y_000240 [Pseudomonas sp. TE3786]
MKFSRIAGALALAALVSGCSTSTYFKLPEHSKVEIYKRETTYSEGLVKTRPFAWSAAGGIPYKLTDDSGTVLQEGKLRSRFRVASIFWPPFAIIYWPMGYGQRCYDLTGATPLTCTEQDMIDLRSKQRLAR